jgi:hypothetical protein
VYEPNVAQILKRLKPSDVVLDVGGWACPFNRANYVLDVEPYETRGYYHRTSARPAAQGGDREYFTPATWITRDICDRAPYPFADKSIDFVVCSHTLEDVRDPLWVCAEMMRIGKRGYVEVPSRAAESSRGWEHPRLAGLSHHRWLIDIDGSHIRFLMKYHRIHSHWRLSLPAAWLARLPEVDRVQWLFWEDAFTVEETRIHGSTNMDAELERFVRSVRPYPRWRLEADAAWRRGRALSRRAWRAARGAPKPGRS